MHRHGQSCSGEEQREEKPGRCRAHLDLPVTGAGREQTVIWGEGAAEHLVIVRLDLCQLLTRGAFEHLTAEAQ